MSATIIAFPAPRAAPDARATDAPPLGDDRLKRALAGLEAALDGQRAAVAQWRATMDGLGMELRNLQSGVARYQGTLGAVGTQVAAVGAQARWLERWADRHAGADAAVQ